MKLIKTTILNGVAVSTKMITSVLLNKVLAIYVGPAGFAVIGQFQNFLSVVSSISSGAFGTGVTKFTAEFGEDPQKQNVLWRTALLMGIIFAIICGVIIFVLRLRLASWLLGNNQYSKILIWLPFSLVLMVLNGLMLSILNGKKAIGPLISANICGSLVTAVCTILLVTNGGLSGALIAITINQAIAFFFTLYIFQKAIHFSWNKIFSGFDKTIAIQITNFAVMALTSAITVPVSQMIIRNSLVNIFGWQETGLWQALCKISDLHLMLLSTTLVIYFLPRFSEILEKSALQSEIKKAYIFVLPLVSISSFLIFLLKDYIITILMSAEFMPINAVLGWQLLGDILRIGSWVSAYVLISKAKTKSYIFLEILFSLTFMAFTYAGAKYGGLRGTAIAYVITYSLYWLSTHAACKKMIFEA